MSNNYNDNIKDTNSYHVLSTFQVLKCFTEITSNPLNKKYIGFHEYFLDTETNSEG